MAYPNRIERLLTILETVVLDRYTKGIYLVPGRGLEPR